MGIRDYVSSTVDSIKRNKPDLTSVKSSYDHGRATATIAKIQDAVVEKVAEHLPDEQIRSKITTDLAKSVAQCAFEELLGRVPGALRLYKMFSRSRQNALKSKEDDVNHNDKNSKEYEKELQELKDKVSRMESEYGKLLEPTEINKPATKLMSRI